MCCCCCFIHIMQVAGNGIMNKCHLTVTVHDYGTPVCQVTNVQQMEQQLYLVLDSLDDSNNHDNYIFVRKDE